MSKNMWVCSVIISEVIRAFRTVKDVQKTRGGTWQQRAECYFLLPMVAFLLSQLSYPGVSILPWEFGTSF